MNVTEEVQHAGPRARRWGLKAAVAATVVVTGSLSWMAVAKHSDARGVSGELIGSATLPAATQLRTTGSSDVSIYKLTIRPGATGGWHSHRGPVVVTVAEGTATFYEAHGDSCIRETYKAGQAVVEQPGVIHTTRNEGKVDLVIHGVAMAPKDRPLAIPQLRPAKCHH